MSPPQRILIISSGLGIGGAERALLQLSLAWRAAGREIQIVCLAPLGEMAGSFLDEGFVVRELKIRSGNPLSLWRLLKLHALCRDFAPDVILGWMYHGNIAAALARGLFAKSASLIEVLHHSVGNLKQQGRYIQALVRLGCWAARRADKVIYVSQTARRQHEALGYDKGRGGVIPNGFVLPPALAEKDKSTAREKLALPAHSFIVGHLARNHPMKNHAGVLDAAEALLPDHPEMLLLLGGPGVEPGSKPIYGHKILECPENIRVLGTVTDTDTFYAACDIVVLGSSYGEAFPMVIGEAMSRQRPCAVTDVGDCAYLVGDTGVVAEDSSAETLAASWTRLIDMPPQERNRLGAAARNRIEENFDQSMVANEYLRIFDQSRTS